MSWCSGIFEAAETDTVRAHTHTHKQILYFCYLSLVRLPDFGGGGLGGGQCDKDISEMDLGVFAALGLGVQTTRSDRK